MERPLTDWEAGVLARLVSIDGSVGGPDPAALRESLPHLVVTGVCDCGCASFFVRDTRQESASETEEVGLFHYSNAATPDRRVGMFLLVQDEHPWSVDVMLPPELDGSSPEARPDPAALIVTTPNDE